MFAGLSETNAGDGMSPRRRMTDRQDDVRSLAAAITISAAAARRRPSGRQ